MKQHEYVIIINGIRHTVTHTMALEWMRLFLEMGIVPDIRRVREHK